MEYVIVSGGNVNHFILSNYLNQNEYKISDKNNDKNNDENNDINNDGNKIESNKNINKSFKLIGVDKGIEALYSLNIKPDLILGDFDSINNKIFDEFRNRYNDVEVLRYKPEKDYTDTELAMQVAIKNKASKITLFGVTGTRVDHMLASIRTLYLAHREGIFAEIIDEHNKIYLVENMYSLYKKNMYGKYVSLLPFEKKVEGITLKGFKYELENAIMQYGSSLGVSNEVIADEAVIECKKGILIVIESRD